jgi:hypothetical protein
MDFLQAIPKESQYQLRFEDLVSDPQIALAKLCHAIHIRFHPILVKPYDRLEKKMTHGIFEESKPMGDTNFFEHGRINPNVGDSWKDVLSNNFLSDMIWGLAQSLDYEKIDDDETTLPLSTAQEK